MKARAGSPDYGLAIIFEVLCAGRIEFATRDPAGGTQQVPVLCTDEDDMPLPPSDYVIGISRVYAYPDRINTNPVIEAATFEQRRHPRAGHHGRELHDGEAERLQGEQDRPPRLRRELGAQPFGGGARRRAARADLGGLVLGRGHDVRDSRLLFDTRDGRVGDTEVKYHAPKDVTDGTIWGVVHDNRGGATWLVIPLHVR